MFLLICFLLFPSVLWDIPRLFSVLPGSISSHLVCFIPFHFCSVPLELLLPSFPFHISWVGPVWITSLLHLLCSIQAFYALFHSLCWKRRTLFVQLRTVEVLTDISFRRVFDLDHSCKLMDGASTGPWQYRAFKRQKEGSCRSGSGSAQSTQNICIVL